MLMMYLSIYWKKLSEINSPLITEVRGQGLMVGIQMTIETAQIVKLVMTMD